MPQAIFGSSEVGCCLRARDWHACAILLLTTAAVAGPSVRQRRPLLLPTRWPSCPASTPISRSMRLRRLTLPPHD